MYTGILKRSDYEKLMSMTRVGDVVRWLKESRGYGNALKDVSDTSVHRNLLESAFDNALIEDANKLKHMLGNDGKRMLTVLMTRIEIMMLKRILRAIYTGFLLRSARCTDCILPKHTRAASTWILINVSGREIFTS